MTLIPAIVTVLTRPRIASPLTFASHLLLIFALELGLGVQPVEHVHQLVAHAAHAGIEAVAPGTWKVVAGGAAEVVATATGAVGETASAPVVVPVTLFPVEEGSSRGSEADDGPDKGAPRSWARGHY
jgi:hypothetical protein